MTRLLCLAVFAIVLTGCSSGPDVQFYVLEPLNSTNSTSVEAAKAHTIGIGPVSVPTLLEHRQIITRLSNNAVQISESQQWAEPLPDNLQHTLTRNLATLQPGHIIRSYPWDIHGMVDLQIVIDIIRFDTTPGKSANLEANWSIKNEKTHVILKSGHTVITHLLADSSYPGSVRALSKILGEFSQSLSLAMQKLEFSH
ncbi:MAG: PqiC family protein [Methyloglobulus sp.]|nr:membrane integrity-associated transporter subunit PqiC [Methyloglobulus sp.]